MRGPALRLLCLALVAPALLAAEAPVADGPHVEDVARLADVHRAATPAEALLAADRLAAEPWAAALGIDYLRGALLEQLGRPSLAAQAFAAAMARAPLLAPWCRLRIARLQAPQHPEMAAGLLVPLLSRKLPATLREQAAELLESSVRAGADCRLLARVEWGALPAAERRALAVTHAECLRPSDPQQTQAALQALVTQDASDAAAWEAALQLAGTERARLSPEVQLDIGRAFARHGEPELASAFLGPLATRLPARLHDAKEVETMELLGLAQMAREAFTSAIGTFARLAERAERSEARARALYEEGWARELAGDRAGALLRYTRAANLVPGRPSTAEPLLAACRVQWLLGRDGDARKTYLVLRSRPEWSAPAAAAASFLAVSQLARGEVGDAPGLLQQSMQIQGGRTPELLYWTARGDEAQGHTSAAVALYARLLRELPYHPLAAAARERLAGEALQGAVRAAVDAGRRSRRREERLTAWLLLWPGDPRREPLRLGLYQLWARDATLAPYLRLAAVDPAEWPLWHSPLADAEERLLALGGWSDVGTDAILRHFPLHEPALAFTAARRLAAVGDAGRSIALAQRLAASALEQVPPQLLPLQLRETLFPRLHATVVEAAARRTGVEPALVWAVMREASLYGAHAVTPWGGRGPLLLRPAAAQRLARAAGGDPRASDVEDPATAIPLGALRLAQLAAAFPGRPASTVAAHVAGLAPARLWTSWCVSTDPAELLAKIPDEEARAMTMRILAAEIAYRELAPVLREPRTP